MNNFGFDSQLSNLGPKVALFLVAISLSAIPLAIILSFISSRVLAAAESDRDERGRRENKRRFWRAAVLMPLICAALYMALDPSLITRAYGIVSKSKATATKPQEVQVWVNKRSGLYYCAGTKLYGKLQPGKEMRERSAVQSGFQPALGQMCSSYWH